MTDPRVQSAQDDVARYAEDAKRNLTGDSGGGVFGGIIGVIRDMGARADALAAGARAGEMALNPDYLSAVTKEFDRLGDIVGELQGKAAALTRRTPLGLGYGEQIGDMNAQYGVQAADMLEELVRKIKTMKEAVKASVANYRRVEDDAASGFDKM